MQPAPPDDARGVKERTTPFLAAAAEVAARGGGDVLMEGRATPVVTKNAHGQHTLRLCGPA